MIGQVEPSADPTAKRISPALSDTPPFLFCGPFRSPLSTPALLFPRPDLGEERRSHAPEAPRCTALGREAGAMGGQSQGPLHDTSWERALATSLPAKFPGKAGAPL